jgi:thioredoxin-dependent peroxiredoxin
MTQERFGAVTLKGKPLTVLGAPLAVGDKAPAFELVANDLSKVNHEQFAGKVRLISVVPSLDTGICDQQTRRFNEEAASFGDDVVILAVSAEHPWNQRRWCGATGVEQVKLLSDHLEMNFGAAFGTYIKELRLNQRSVFVIDRDDTVRYVEYVPEIAQFPDFDRALAALRAAVA